MKAECVEPFKRAAEKILACDEGASVDLDDDEFDAWIHAMETPITCQTS